ncbi:MAG: YabP/YqfC family sporulation protein [Clostridia bacterium]|nr:YabP/YqfC family sporulation protein [Clostridia bacterium]
MENEKRTPPHNVSMTNRSHMHLTAVTDVSSFDDRGILLELGEESLSIEGEHLHIEAFDADRGELSLTGHVTGLLYFKKTPKKGKRTFLGGR